MNLPPSFLTLFFQARLRGCAFKFSLFNILTYFFPGEIEGVREAEGEGEGRRAVDCTSVLRSVLRKGTFRLSLRFRYIIYIYIYMS